MKIFPQLKFDNNILGVITQSFNWKYQLSFDTCQISKSTQIFDKFTMGMIGNETDHLLKCVLLYGKLINICEIKHILRINIAGSSLKI